jgi:DNA-binding CsgD family transcriptional regulator
MDSVTLREREVLQLLAQGLSTKEIATSLGISFHTVESHRKNLRSKFSARNSTEMLVKFVKLTAE